MKKLIAGLLALTLTVASLAGCTQSGRTQQTQNQEGQTQTPPTQITESQTTALQTPEPLESDSAWQPVVLTDGAGRQVTIETEPQRIVSGYYITTSLLIALGVEDRLVAIEAKAKDRPIYSLAAPQLLDLPSVGTAKAFDLEICVATQPDLIILPIKLKEQADILSDMGLTVLVVSPESTELLKQTIDMVGQATHTRQRAEALLLYYEQQTAKMLSITGQQKERPRVLITGTGEVLKVATSEMYQNSVIELAGGVNAAKDLTDPSWAKISYEQMLACNPEVMVVIPEAGYTAQDVLADVQLAQVDAIKNKRVYQMPVDFEAWDSPVPSGILGAMWLTSKLHGQAYPPEEFASDAAAFYEQFYEVQIDQTLLE